MLPSDREGAARGGGVGGAVLAMRHLGQAELASLSGGCESIVEGKKRGGPLPPSCSPGRAGVRD